MNYPGCALTAALRRLLDLRVRQEHNTKDSCIAERAEAINTCADWFYLRLILNCHYLPSIPNPSLYPVQEPMIFYHRHRRRCLLLHHLF